MKEKEHTIKNCEKYRKSNNFQKHGADGLKKYLKTKKI